MICLLSCSACSRSRILSRECLLSRVLNPAEESRAQGCQCARSPRPNCRFKQRRLNFSRDVNKVLDRKLTFARPPVSSQVAILSYPEVEAGRRRIRDRWLTLQPIMPE
jgi:hypothetical protein